MGPDKITVYTYIDKLNIDYNSWFDSSINDKGTIVKRYTYGKTNSFWIEYFPCSGLFRVQLNIPKLIHGDNTIPSMIINLDIIRQLAIQEAKYHEELAAVFIAKDFPYNWTIIQHRLSGTDDSDTTLHSCHA